MTPRSLNPKDAKLVAVQLKRKKELKKSHLQAYIRPEKVLKAVEYLKEIGNPFYQDVKINEEFTLKEVEEENESQIDEQPSQPDNDDSKGDSQSKVNIF